MFVLGLPTGGTPLGMYQKLVQAHKAGKVSFKYVITFNMDEYVGIPEDHPESYHRSECEENVVSIDYVKSNRYMFDNFFKHIDIDPKNAHVLDGNAKNLVAECEEYERKITAAGGIELFVGGRETLNSIQRHDIHTKYL